MPRSISDRFAPPFQSFEGSGKGTKSGQSPCKPMEFENDVGLAKLGVHETDSRPNLAFYIDYERLSLDVVLGGDITELEHNLILIGG